MTSSLSFPKLKKSSGLRLAFYGPMVSGKTFCANYLVKHFGFYKIALADKLKSVVYDLYGVSSKDGIGRKILQEFADDCKKWDADVFIKHFLTKVKYSEEQGNKFIICDDVRFLREAQVLKRNGFTLIRIDCSDEILSERLAVLYPNTAPESFAHRSEREFNVINEFNKDGLSINSSSYDAFYDIGELVRKLKDE